MSDETTLLETGLATPRGKKPSVQYRTSSYTVEQYCALPYTERRAVDAACDERAGLTYTTHDDETSEKPYTVGRATRMPKGAQQAPFTSAEQAQVPSTTSTPMTTYVHPAPSPALHYLNTPELIAHDAAHPDNEHTSAVAMLKGLHYDIVAVAGHYVNLTASSEDTDWTHWGYSPFLGGTTHSFAVNEATGMYKCFTSLRSGEALDLVMFMEECSEAEALVWLAAHFSESDAQPDEHTIAPVAEGADGPSCAYPGYPVGPATAPALPEVVHETGPLPLPTPSTKGEEPVPDFAELAQATTEAIAPAAPAAPIAVDGTVYSTTDYDMFHLLPENRPVDIPHVRKLVAMISETNLLHLKPLDVTPDMGVIDGQHRLAAARELGVPVYYKVGQQLNQQNIIALNVAQKNWQGADYQHYWAVLGKSAYVVFDEFRTRHPSLSFSNVKMMLQGSTNNRIAEFQAGTWEVRDLERAEIVAGLVERIVTEAKFKGATYTRFVASVYHCVANVNGFDPEEFLHKILKQPLALVSCVTHKQHMELFEKIYNYRTRQENQVSFS